MDAAAALEARLASLEVNGFKLNPATANPGEPACLAAHGATPSVIDMNDSPLGRRLSGLNIALHDMRRCREACEGCREASGRADAPCPFT